MYYSNKELHNIGFTKVGKNVQVSKLAKFYSIKGFIGDNSRIDDFAILKGHIKIGKYVHISSFNYLASVGGLISIGNYTGISANVSIYSVTDDYIGNYMTNPTINKKFRKIIMGKVIISENVSIGAGAVILPNVTVGHSASIGAQSVVNKKIKSGYIYLNRGQEIYRKLKDLNEIKNKIKKFKKLNSTI